MDYHFDGHVIYLENISEIKVVLWMVNGYFIASFSFFERQTKKWIWNWNVFLGEWDENNMEWIIVKNDESLLRFLFLKNNE